MDTVRRLGSPVTFLVIVATVYSAAFYIRGVLSTLESPQLIASALVVDLVVLVPVAYYFLVVRRFGLPAISVAGIFVLSLIAASQIIPHEQRRVVAPLEIIAGVAEIAILSFVVWKAVRGIRRFRSAAAEHHDDDVLNVIRSAARQVVGHERVADMLASELATFYYALGSWRRCVAEGPGVYTSHKRNAYGATLFGIGLLLIVELIAVHLLVQHFWSTTGAWILSILSAYAGVWLLSEWRAHRLRPSLITAKALILRAGVRWEITIPFVRIQSFRRVSALEDKPRGALNLIAVGDPLFEVTTDEPVEARGPYGYRKSTTCVWFTIDDASAFDETLSRQLPGATGEMV